MGIFNSSKGSTDPKRGGGFTVTGVSQGGRKAKAVRNETTKPSNRLRLNRRPGQ
ncbi:MULTISPECIES: hypothetical protein [Micromonospora]|uniref:hypothetical protein n=1 Tax=Micromonospora TaxID=1873 RepID=UPI0012FDBBBD|nr:hypothetical protein [Micromonospora sp. WMMA2032]